jgi:hypothetical protein
MMGTISSGGAPGFCPQGPGVGPNEVGLNRIFGRYTGKTGPGLNYNLPVPIGSVERLQVTNRNMINIGSAFRQDTRTPNAQIPLDLPEESLMLTGAGRTGSICQITTNLTSARHLAS